MKKLWRIPEVVGGKALVSSYRVWNDSKYYANKMEPSKAYDNTGIFNQFSTHGERIVFFNSS